MRTTFFLILTTIFCSGNLFAQDRGPHATRPQIAGLETVGVEAWVLKLKQSVRLDPDAKRNKLFSWAELSSFLRMSKPNQKAAFEYLLNHPMWETGFAPQDLWNLGRSLYEARRRTQALKSLKVEDKRAFGQLFSFLAEETFYIFNQVSGPRKETLTWGGVSCGQARSGRLLGVRVCPGDVLLTKGEALSSSMLSRFADRPGSFSHAALIHVLPSGEVVTIESFIEDGVKFRRAADVEARPLKRAFVYRLARDLEGRDKAFLSLQKALDDFYVASRARVGDPFKVTLFPYDFEMIVETESTEPAMFCSEVPEWVYRSHAGLPRSLNPYPSELWSTISGSTREFFSKFLGVMQDRLPAPSDLDIHPNFEIVGARLSTQALWEDRLHVAFIDSLLALARENPKAFSEILASLDDVPEVIVDQKTLEWLKSQDWVPEEYRKQIGEHVPVGINAKQLVFFFLLNKWAAQELAKDFKGLKSEIVDPVELRIQVRHWIAKRNADLKEDLRRAASRFPRP